MPKIIPPEEINAEAPAVVFEFTTVTGKKLRRTFTIKDAPDEPDVPSWLTDVRKVWNNPQDPITYVGFIQRGHEADARRWLKELKPSGGK